MKNPNVLIPFAGIACAMIRKEMGITRVFVANAWDMHPSQLLGYENRVEGMRLSMLERYAQTIKVEPIEILKRAHELYVAYLQKKFDGNQLALDGLSAINGLLDVPALPKQKNTAVAETQPIDRAPKTAKVKTSTANVKARQTNVKARQTKVKTRLAKA